MSDLTFFRYFLTNDEAGIGLQGYDFGGTVLEKT